MAQKNEATKSVVGPLVMDILTTSVSASLSLLSVDAEKVKEITAAMSACTPQELPVVMSMLNSFQQARIMEILLMDWDKQRKEDEQRRTSTGLTSLTKVLN
jgi:hypothetical protein